MTGSQDAEFQQLLTPLAPDLRAICVALRELVGQLHSERVELVWLKQGIASFGVGPKKMTEHYVYVAPQSKHVNLGFYHGVELADPAGLLEGSGKRLRHIKLRSVEGAERAGVRELVAAAIEERRVSLG
jgi:hypothetical protein